VLSRNHILAKRFLAIVQDSALAQIVLVKFFNQSGTLQI
jgi:hypothetical protein